MSLHLRAVCPSCGKDTIAILIPSTIGAPNTLWCENEECTERLALQKIIEEPEVDHLVTIKDNGTWTVRHPLVERIGNRVLECTLGSYLAEAQPDEGDGTYRASPGPDLAYWTLVPLEHKHEISVFQ